MPTKIGSHFALEVAMRWKGDLRIRRVQQAEIYGYVRRLRSTSGGRPGSSSIWTRGERLTVLSWTMKQASLCSSNCPRRREAARRIRLPLNHYDALRAVALVGDDHGQAGRPYEERAKVSHGLCVQRHAAFNFDPHLVAAAAEAFSQIVDRRRFVWRLHRKASSRLAPSKVWANTRSSSKTSGCPNKHWSLARCPARRVPSPATAAAGPGAFCLGWAIGACSEKARESAPRRTWAAPLAPRKRSFEESRIARTAELSGEWAGSGSIYEFQTLWRKRRGMPCPLVFRFGRQVALARPRPAASGSRGELAMCVSQDTFVPDFGGCITAALRALRLGASLWIRCGKRRLKPLNRLEVWLGR